MSYRFQTGYSFASHYCKKWGSSVAACDVIVSVNPGHPPDRIAGALRRLASFVERQPDPNETHALPATLIDTDAPPRPLRRRGSTAAAIG